MEWLTSRMMLAWLAYFSFAELLSLMPSQASSCILVSEEASRENYAGDYACASMHEGILRFLDFLWSEASHDNIIAFGTILIALFTFVLYRSTNKLWLAGEKQIELTRIAAHAADLSARAAIALELPVVRASIVGLGFGDAIKNSMRTEHFGIQCFTFSNLGRTNAFPVEVQWGWTVGDKLPDTPIYKANQPFEIDVILKPEQITPFYIPYAEMDIAPGDAERLIRGQVKLWLYCVLIYEDFMQVRHAAGFCWRRNPSMGAGEFRLDATVAAYNEKT